MDSEVFLMALILLQCCLEGTSVIKHSVGGFFTEEGM